MREKEQQRINEIIEVVLQVARGNFEVKAGVSDENDSLDALAMGLNMMIADLHKKKYTEQENARIKILNQKLAEAKTKAEEGERMKMAFLANMSHEIRTPMNGIIGFAQLLKSQQLTPEQQRVYVDMIEKSVFQMLEITNDIVDISKIEAGLMTKNISLVNINQQIDNFYSFFKNEATAKGLQFSAIKALPDSETFVNTDSTKFYSVMVNLIKNAIKYTNQGGIEFGYRVLKSGKEPMFSFFVKDSGIGVPENMHDAIFNRFTRTSEVEINALEGSGLGLAISKAYVEMLGGEIYVESESGKGAEFTFTLPFVRNGEEFATLKMDDSLLPAFEKQDDLKVLVVEDDALSEHILKRIVEKITGTILFARDGLEAVEICRKHSDIDLVFMDIWLPIMRGDEAVKEIRKFNSCVHIVAMTAYGVTGDREKLLLSGFDEYMDKPIVRAELLPVIQKCLRMKRVRAKGILCSAQ